MQNLHSDTVGYRIRKARENLGANQKEFAQLIGVSKNYVGVIERGDDGKGPSLALLTKIAEVTGTSYLWLLDGKEDIDTLDLGIDLAEPKWDGIDVRLLLVLFCAYMPDFSKDDIAQILHISTNELDGILRGEKCQFDQSWNSILPSLAMELNMPDLYEKIRTLSELWVARRAEEYFDTVMYAMETLISNDLDCAVSRGPDMESLFSQGRDKPVRIKLREFRGKASPYARWTCIYVPQAPKMRHQVGEIFRTLLSQYKAQRGCDEMTFVFTDFQQLKMARAEISKVLQAEGSIYGKISVAYVDPNQRHVDYIEGVSE